MQGKSKSIIKLAVVLVLVILMAYLGLNGMQVGKYVFYPFSEALSLGLDLRGGISTEYAAVDTGVDNFDALMDSTVATLRTRLTGAGFTEATVSRQGDDRIRVEIPDVEDPEEIMNIIGTPAHLEFRDPDGNVILEGNDIKSAQAVTLTDTNEPVLQFELNSEGAAKFAEATAAHFGKAISIYLDDTLISSPTVKSVISDGKGYISFTGYNTYEERVKAAQALELQILSGALPLDISEVETRAISATLGVEAIGGAVIAGLIGLILIILFMVVMYRLPGVAASLALVIYVLIVFILLCEISGVQLTLQGIAGILLGMGMAVDANVIIFERFREELHEGRTPLNALKFGYKNALSAILDSNVTTIIAAVVLLMFGTGTIKGFATTLLIGVICSLFTAVFVTRFLLRNLLDLGIQNDRLLSRPYREKKKFASRFRPCAIASCAVIAIALVLQLCGAGSNMGIDFTGGSLLSYAVGENYDTADVELILQSQGYEGYQITKTTASTQNPATEEAADQAAANETAANENTMDETTANEAAADGTAAEQTAANEAATDGTAANETATDGTAANETAADETAADETTADETATDGAAADETAADGTTADGTATDGTATDGTAANQTYKARGLLNLDKSGIVQDGLTDLQIRLPVADAEAAGAVRDALEAEMSLKYEGFRFISIDHVSAVAGHDLIANAVKALLIAFVCMLIYIAIRFDFFSGVAALIALLHDVLVMCAFMVFFRWAFQINSPFIAAVLTIVGYSINNTIIIFDRIRETARTPGYTLLPREEIVDVSVGATLSRTLNTSITTLITLVCLFIFGVSSIREFAFPLIVGMLAGTYSSVMLSGQLWARLIARFGKRAKAAKE